ncbi:MAG: hypothetical protein PVJ68_17145, partial [Candidatus Thiodiazotropha sp.]
PVGRNDLHGEDRYGNVTSLTGDQGFGYGLKLLARQRASNVFPSDIVIDQETGVAISNGGYIYESNLENLLAKTIQDIPFPDSTLAATFDIQQPDQPLLVGGVSSLPEREALERHLQLQLLMSLDLMQEINPNAPSLTDDERALMELLKGSLIDTSIDSIRIHPAQELEEGVLRKRLYLAAGIGGVIRLNLDDQNGLQVLSRVAGGDTDSHVTDVVKWGDAAFAARADAVMPDDTPDLPCDRLAGLLSETGAVDVLSYLDLNDPVELEKLPEMVGGNVVAQDGQWLYTGGVRESWVWNTSEQCVEMQSPTADKPANAEESIITGINVFDPVLTRQYAFTANVLDIAFYGDYMIVALADSGVEIFHKEIPETRAVIKFDEGLQSQGGRGMQLRVFGNLLFVSADLGGVIVYDIADPMQPYVISAGNTEFVQSLDIYKQRIVAGSGKLGLTVLELPGALVTGASVEEGGLLIDSEDLIVNFNEPVTELSLQQTGVVSVVELDSGSAVTPSLTPVDLQEGAASRYRIGFSRTPGSQYEVRIDDARNLRGGGLWHPFVWRGVAAAAGALQPVIDDVENGLFHRGDNQEVRIIGSGFRDDPAVEVFVDQYLIPHQWIDANTLYLAPGAIEQLPLQDGLHHVRVSDSGLDAYSPGSILIGAELDLATFAIAPDSGQVEGGGFVTITSNTPVILPGSKVIMRSREGVEIRTEEVSPGVYIVNLQDDVKGLTEMSFQLPGVLPPDLLYDVYLSSAGKELFVGSFSYTLDAGRGIELPNYPPMVIGGAETVGDTLFVGVKAGSPPTAENRFLMQSGFEIYDIGIWDRPIRLAQLTTAQPVTGVATFGGVAYLASGSDGLLEVDIQDLSAPQIVRTFGVPGNSATDVAIHKGRSILAMSVANSLGSGYIRFFDLNDSELDAPTGYGTIALNQDELRGQPVDIEWQGDRLYLLLQRDGQLYLVIFDDLGGNRTHSIQVIDRAGAPDSWDEASFVVQYGQIGISNGEEFLILQPDDQNGFETVYWQAVNSTGSELFLNQGGLFQAGSQGIKDTPTPNLAVTSITPPSGSDLTPTDVIRIQLNELFNTDEAELRSAVSILDSLDAPLPANTYTLTGVNTLAGGYIDIAFNENLSHTGAIKLQLDSNLSALNGRNLVQAVEASYTMGSGVRPGLDYVARVDNDIAGLHYFHGDGTELAELQGSGFGTDAGALRI